MEACSCFNVHVAGVPRQAKTDKEAKFTYDKSKERGGGGMLRCWVRQSREAHACTHLLQGEMLSEPRGRRISCWMQRWTQLLGDSQRIKDNDSLALRTAIEQDIETPRQLVQNIVSTWPKAVASQFSRDPSHLLVQLERQHFFEWCYALSVSITLEEWPWSWHQSWSRLRLGMLQGTTDFPATCPGFCTVL